MLRRQLPKKDLGQIFLIQEIDNDEEKVGKKYLGQIFLIQEMDKDNMINDKEIVN